MQIESRFKISQSNNSGPIIEKSFQDLSKSSCDSAIERVVLKSVKV